MRLRIVLFCASLLLPIGTASPALGQCDTFPWIVTGSDVPGGVVVNVCGLWVGCTPHNPQVTVSGDQIHVTFTAAELPSCQCIQPHINFNHNVLVPSLPQGTYTVTATVVDCGQPQVVGTENIVSGALASVPVLDLRGMTALALLLGVVALWKLRALS
jgi:hypothetical protein